MIDIIKEILIKLASNVEKYKVYIDDTTFTGGTNYYIRYTLKDDTFFISCYWNDEFIIIGKDYGSRVRVDISKDDKPEIFYLIDLLKKECDKYIKEEFASFAKSVEIPEVNTIDNLV